MKKVGKKFIITTVAISFVLGLMGSVAAHAAGPAPINLLSAANFVVLSKTGITDTGSHSSAIVGNIGSSPITAAAMNDVFCSEITGTIYGVDAAYVGSGATTCFAGNPPSANKTLVDNAVADMQTAYADAAGRTDPTATELGSGNIGGMTLAPGLYKWSTDVDIPTDVTLSGGPNDIWIFQIAGNLNISSGASVPAGIKVILAGGAQASNVFWQVGGATGATLGTYTTFNGTILSAKQVIIETGAVLNGRALAQTQVTLDADAVTIPSPSVVTITPTSTLTVADIAILKTANVTSTTPGGTVDYTVKVTDNGPATSTGVVANDALPSGLTLENATASIGSYATSTGIWTIGTVDPSSTETLTIQALVNASGTASTTITNRATVTESASTTDPDLANNSSSVSIFVSQPVVTPTSTAPVVINLGGIEDYYTPNFSEKNGDYNDVIFSFSSSSTVKVISQNGILAPLTSALVNTSGTIYWDNYSEDGPEENIGYCVLGNGNCPSIGGPFSNIQYYAGSGGAQPQDMLFSASGSVTMHLLAKITGYATSDAVEWYDPATPSVLHMIFTGADATGTSVTFTPSSVFGLYLDNGHGEEFPSQNLLDVGDPLFNQHFAMFDVTPITPTSTPTSTLPSADIAILKTASVTSTTPGGTVDYTVKVTDNGPATSTGVVANDALPSGITFDSATTSVGSYASSTGTWIIGTLSARSTATLMIEASVNSGTEGDTITNRATVTESASTTDPDLANNSSSVSIFVQSSGGGGGPCTTLLTESQFEAALKAGQIGISNVHFTTSTASFTITNSASCPLPLISLSAYKAFVPPGPGWVATQQFFDGTSTPMVAVNASTTLTVNLAPCLTQVDLWYGAAPTSLNTTSTFSYPDNPFLLGYGVGGGAVCQSVASSSADIAIMKTVDNANPQGGATINYTVVVTDNGPATSTNVVAFDQLPLGLSLISATTSQGSYAMTGDWDIGTLSPSSTATLSYSVAVSSAYAGQSISNTATVSQLSSIVDPNLGNNSSTVTINIQDPATSATSESGGSDPTVGVAGGGVVGSTTAPIDLTGGEVVGGSNANDASDSGGQVLGASTSCGPYLDGYIRMGWNNSPIEVDKLEVFLDQNLGINLPITGIYSQQDFSAVEQFQVKYGSQVLAPWIPLGLPNQATPTGFVYQTTEWWINNLECEALDIPMPLLQNYQTH